MDNFDFLKTIRDSFYVYLKTGSRSNEKLKVLHGAIASDFAEKLDSSYVVKSLGFGPGKEDVIQGRYVNKVVDIVISKNNEVLAGIGVKFIMSNYLQNSNNYFENMLGETANIRTNGIAYYQILILPEILPYFERAGIIKKWEHITKHNLEKYIVLSNDDTNVYLHTPTKTLLYLIKFPKTNFINNRKDWINYYLSNCSFDINCCEKFDGFGRSLILNDYESFKNKVAYHVQSI